MVCGRRARESVRVNGAWTTTESTDPVVIGEKFHIESKVLAETRTHIIHTPASYKGGKDAHPVDRRQL
jgi:hypothetical protein